MIKILLIDDSIFTLHHYADMINKMGYEVITAEGGQEGIDSFAKEKPHLVLCDLMMPEMDGFEVLERISKLHPVSSVFLFVTADIQEHTRKKALAMGAKGLIPKPLTEELLRKVLSEYGC